MSDPGAFQVDSASLMSYAGVVDTIGHELTSAAQAAQTVRTDTGVYGQLCQFFPFLLNGLQQEMVDGIDTAAGSVHETADALRSVAASYDTADDSAAERIRNTR